MPLVLLRALRAIKVRCRASALNARKPAKGRLSPDPRRGRGSLGPQVDDKELLDIIPEPAIWIFDTVGPCHRRRVRIGEFLANQDIGRQNVLRAVLRVVPAAVRVNDRAVEIEAAVNTFERVTDTTSDTCVLEYRNELGIA